MTLEAFQSGRPVVTTLDAGGPLEFVTEGENGRVVAAGTAQQLSSREDVKEFYLGVGDRGRKTFRDRKYERSPVVAEPG